ncbi:hypothetical protein ACFLQ0_05170 [Nitrospinota bacterium]
MNDFFVGQVTCYYEKIGFAALQLEEPLTIGDPIYIRGEGISLEQIVDSMRVGDEPIESGLPGESVCIRVVRKVCPGDRVYLE